MNFNKKKTLIIIGVLGLIGIATLSILYSDKITTTIFKEKAETEKEAVGEIPEYFIDEAGFNDPNFGFEEQDKTNVEWAEGEVIVKFKDDMKEKVESVPENKPKEISIASVAEVNNKFNAQKIEPLIEMNRSEDNSTIVKMEYPKEASVLQIAQELEAKEEIEYAEPNYIVHPTNTPTDSFFGSSNSWGQGYDDLWGLKKIESEAAWDHTTGSNNIIVAVIDTGYDYTHKDIKDNAWNNTAEINGQPNVDDDGNGYVDDKYGYDFKNNDGDPFDFGDDDGGHGSHVSGTIAGVANNGTGVAGAAWNAKIMGVKFLGTGGGRITGAINAIDYAVNNGAKILNNSWGGNGYSQALQDKINWAVNERGAIFIAAAGNEDQDTANTLPGGMNNVISIGATDINDAKASFSNWGQKVDLSAPGVGILSVRGMTVTYCNSYPCPGVDWTVLQGTSMAAPHVSGIAVLMRAIDPTLTQAEIEARLIQTADPINQVAGKPIGPRLNARKAVESLIPENPTLTISQVTLDDSAGNNNKAIDPGETVKLVIELENTSANNATGVATVLSTTEGQITVSDANANYGDIAPQAKKNNGTDVLQITASAQIPIGKEITFKLDITSNNGNYATSQTFNKITNTVEVSGLINQDTNWDRNTQYLVTGDTLVNQNVILTIPYNVKVLFKDFYEMRVMGTLIANGEPDKRIIFTTLKPENERRKYWGDWKQLSFGPASRASITFAQIEYAQVGINAWDNYTDIEVNNTLFIHNRIGMTIGHSIKQKTSPNEVHPQGNYHQNVLSNVFAQNVYGILLGNYFIEGNTGNISQSGAIWSTISQNLITNNYFSGIQMFVNDQSHPSIHNNDILPHTYHATNDADYHKTVVRMGEGLQEHVIDMSDNFWGNAQIDEIGFYIMDNQDNAVLGKINTGTIAQQPKTTGSADRDNDGMTDTWEYAYGFDPTNGADKNSDPDADGITTFQEYQQYSHPRQSDTDFDTMRDTVEKQYNFNPIYPNSPPVHTNLSQISADQTNVAIGTPVTVTITLRDRKFKPVSGKNVQIASSNSTDTIQQPTQPTNANGVTTGRVTRGVKGISKITMVDTSDSSLPLSQYVNIQAFVPEAPKPPAPPQPPTPKPPTSPKPPETPQPHPPQPDPTPEEPDQPVRSGSEAIATGPHTKHQSLVRQFDTTGKQISAQFNAYPAEFNLGVRMATGDIDGDGVEEIVVGSGAGGGPQIRVFEKDGSLKPIQFFAFHPDNRDGVDVATGDVDGDGKDEIAVIQYQNQEAWTKVYRYNNEHTIVGEWLAFPAGMQVGASVTMGDIDADGQAEVIVGAGEGGGPQIRVFEADGTRKPIQFFAFHPNGRTGVDVAADDVDQDGKAEIIVSQRTEESWVKVYRYDDHQTVLGTWRAYPAGVLSGANVSTVDVDQDGRWEILVAPSEGFKPHVRTYNSEGQVVGPNFYAYEQSFLGGVDVAGF